MTYPSDRRVQAAMQLSLYSLVLGTVHALDATQTACHVLLQVVTYTSDVRGAGSDATVFAQLVGNDGTGPRCNLVPSDSKASSFSRGQRDAFHLHLPELGRLQSLTIGRLGHEFLREACANRHVPKLTCSEQLKRLPE